MSNYFFSSESVTEGHPDKMADQISDAVLDAILKQDKKARVACETFLATGIVLVGGEITTKTYVDIQTIARKVIKDIGYSRAKYGFDFLTAGVLNCIGQQSPDIAQGVNQAEESRTEGSKDNYDSIGAGDQGLMFGYASNETPTLMPLPIMKAHQLAKQLADVRKNGSIKWLRPDGKSQVTVRYENDKPVAIDKVLISTQHHPDVSQEEIRAQIIEHVIKPVLDEYYHDDIEIFVNPTGRFVIGGPQGDAGLTGRKIIVDTYGGMGRHGGGAFSGKDPTKVDRSACYMMRHVAKNIVGRWLGRTLRNASRLCDWPRASVVGLREHVRHRQRRRENRQSRRESLRSAPRRHHRTSRFAAPDLRQNRRLRSLWPRRPGLHLGENRSRRSAAKSRARRVDLEL